MLKFPGFKVLFLPFPAHDSLQFLPVQTCVLPCSDFFTPPVIETTIHPFKALCFHATRGFQPRLKVGYENYFWCFRNLAFHQLRLVVYVSWLKQAEYYIYIYIYISGWCWWFRNPARLTTWDVYRTFVNHGRCSTTNLNWLYSRISEAPTVFLPSQNWKKG